MKDLSDTKQRQLSLFPEEIKSSSGISSFPFVGAATKPIDERPPSVAQVFSFSAVKKTREIDAEVANKNRILKLLEL